MVLGMGKHSFGVHDQSVIVRAAIAMIRPRRNLFASMCQPHNPKDHHGSSPVSSQMLSIFLIVSQKSFALWGAVVSVDYESGKRQGRSVSRRYQEKFKAS